MSKIQVLDQQLINKIAAGEVVERPASVVKELIENSVDAGADQVAVEIENGGLDLIAVRDNGCGMSPDDAKMSLRRHATSKIRSISDLHNLATMGFRGEALAAISSVSQFRMVTREKDSVGATEVVHKDGEISVRTSAGPEGTSIEVRGLFHSVPARKKFLKAASTEFRHITDIVTHQALLAPQVGWKLTHNGKVVLDLPKVTDWKSRIQSVLGKDLSANLIACHHQRASFIIDGFLAHPAMARERSKQQYLFVNQRPVTDYLLIKAVKEGFHHHIAHGLQPSFVLQISIAPDLVDVNVHPRKAEVKFADPGSVFREIVHAVRNALGVIADQPYQVMEQKTFASSKPTTTYALRRSSPAMKSSFQFQKAFLPSAPTVRSIAQPASIAMPENDELADWKLLGQIHNAYLIVESPDGLMIVDQHAVAEKVLYEKLLANRQKPKVQSLLVPLVVELSAQQMALIADQLDVFKQIGVELEEFGENTVRVVGIPQDLHARDLKTFVFALLDDMAEEEFDKLASLEERQERMAKYASCRGAIKFGDALAVEEQLQLLRDLKQYNIVACCHGRPAVFKMTREQLNRHFHRP